jgi:predicted dithiol-disulfide oxidoreductase (DUF899 family)
MRRSQIDDEVIAEFTDSLNGWRIRILKDERMTNMAQNNGGAATAVEGHRVVSRADWLAAARDLLAKEKELTRARDAVAAKRREMPWEKVEKQYTFDTPAGKRTLADLFQGKNQLIVYHFMFGPDWEEGCPGCSLVADTFNGNAPHIEARDVTFTAVSRAPLAKLDAFKKRMGWSFKWASSGGSDFNSDFGVSFTEEQREGTKPYNFGTAGFPKDEAPGMSVFYKNAKDEIFHTYSSYGRGLEDVMAVYGYLDRVPKGREEAGLERPMAWVRHHDKYSPKLVELK